MEQELEEQMNKSLSEIYFDPSKPGSYSSLDNFFQHVKNLGYTREQVKSWLERNDVYTVFKKVTRKFRRPRVVVPRKDYLWDMDTFNMVKYSSENRGYSYCLIAIDIFTRYIWTCPLKTLQTNEMKSVLAELFKQNKPLRCRTDMGTEFVSRVMTIFFKKESIIHFTSKNSVKANFAERGVKSIKGLLIRHMYHYQDHNWVDVIAQVTDNYNNSYHTSIKMSPQQARSADPVLVWQNQYGLHSRSYLKPYFQKYHFNINDKVRISKYKKSFERAYDQKFTDELFIIADREHRQGIALYTIKSWSNEPIIGKFYEAELQKVIVDDNTTYKIEHLVRKKTLQKRAGYIVKWQGWGSEFNSWVPVSEIKDIDKYIGPKQN